MHVLATNSVIKNAKVKTNSSDKATEIQTKVKMNGQRIPPTRDDIVHIANALFLYTMNASHSTST